LERTGREIELKRKVGGIRKDESNENRRGWKRREKPKESRKKKGGWVETCKRVGREIKGKLENEVLKGQRDKARKMRMGGEDGERGANRGGGAERGDRTEEDDKKLQERGEIRVERREKRR